MMKLSTRATPAPVSRRRVRAFFGSYCVLAALAVPAGEQNRHLDIATRVATEGSFVDTAPWVTKNAAETIERQIVESPIIVVGQAVTNQSRVTADGRDIAMDHEIVVLDVLKGDIAQGSTLFVVIPGGQVEFDGGLFAQFNVAGMLPPAPGRRYVWFLERAQRYYLTGADQEELYQPASGPLGIWELGGGLSRLGIVSPIGELRSPLSLAILSQGMMPNEFIKMIRALVPTLPNLADASASHGGRRAALTASQMSATRALRALWTGSSIRKTTSLLEAPHDIYWRFSRGVHAPRSTPTSVEEQVRRGVCQTDAVVIGTLTTSASFLTDDALDVLTEYKLHVTEPLVGSIVPGSHVSYVRPGGAVNIRGHIIRVTSQTFPELKLGVRYIFFLREVPGEANSFAVTIGERSTWVADAIEIGDLAVGRSPWSLKELKEGVEIARVLNAIDAGACQ